MRDQFELRITPHPRDRASALDAVEQLAQEHRMNPQGLHALQLALEEHLTNVTNHGFAGGGAGEIVVHGFVRRGALEIEIADDGRPFDPTQHPAPELNQPIEQRAVGGLGIHMIRRSTDEFAYRRNRGRNIVTLRKNIA